MREIKFRAWDGAAMNMNPLTFPEKYPLRTLMQFTGLLDKNRNELWENDIVRFKTYTAYRRYWSDLEEIEKLNADFAAQKQKWRWVFGTVIFQCGEFVISTPWEGTVHSHEVHFGESTEKWGSMYGEHEKKKWDFEVIGNIHENPELLNPQPSEADENQSPTV